MQCQELEQVLEQWEPGALTPEAAAHVESCASCRDLVQDLEAIQKAAGRLGQEDLELTPPARLWANLRAQLAAEGLIREPVRAGWLETIWAAIPRPALAGAYLSLLLLAAVLGGLKSGSFQGQTEQATVQQETGNLSAQLNAMEDGSVRALPKSDPDLSATLRQNLQVVDNFIALCEKSVREEPKNELAREYLYSAYHQKADILATMMDRGAPGE